MLLKKWHDSDTCPRCAPSTVGDSPYHAAALGARSPRACIAPASAAIGHHTDTIASISKTWRTISEIMGLPAVADQIILHAFHPALARMLRWPLKKQHGQNSQRMNFPGYNNIPRRIHPLLPLPWPYCPHPPSFPWPGMPCKRRGGMSAGMIVGT